MIHTPRAPKPHAKKRVGRTAQSPQAWCRCVVPAGFRNNVAGIAVVVCINCKLLVRTAA